MGDHLPADIARTTELLRKYFDDDPERRFFFERYVGGGMDAVTWKMKYKPYTAAPVEHMVVKMEEHIMRYDEDFETEDTPEQPDEEDEAAMSLDSIAVEERWLKVRDPPLDYPELTREPGAI